MRIIIIRGIGFYCNEIKIDLKIVKMTVMNLKYRLSREESRG